MNNNIINFINKNRFNIMIEIFTLLIFILSFILLIAGDFWYIKEIRKFKNNLFNKSKIK